MPKVIFILVIILIAVILGAGIALRYKAPIINEVSTNTDVTPCQIVAKKFEFHGDPLGSPIIPHGESSNWDGIYINPGAVLYHDGKFHMFRNGFHDWPGVISVGYMTSADGVHWEAPREEPVLVNTQVPYAQPGLDVSSGIVEEDGTWVLYFHTVNSASTWLIGRATASSPIGPWIADSEPILLNGPTGAWDARHVMWPSVVKRGSEYLMFYGGMDNNRRTQIGLATSQDGIHWTKNKNSITPDSQFAESDPLSLTGQDWDGGVVNRPEVRQTPDGFVMIYQGGPDLNNRGLAVSTDGRTWNLYSNNPLITGDQFPGSGTTTWDDALLYHDGKYYYFMEIGTLASTDIYLAIHEGHFCSK